MGQVTNQLGGFQKSASKVGTLAKGLFAGVVVGKALQGIKSVVDVASDAQQSLGATETVFGKFSSGVIAESKKAAKQFGLDASTYRENANLLGALFSNQGVAAKNLGGATKELIGVGADLSATFGGTTTEAVQSLSSAFKGEFDSLEKYGISLKESTISAELAARGQDKLTGAALAAAKQQVTTDLIMKQSSKSRGAFAKESNTLAHQQQVLSAQFNNLKATLGTALLPVITKVISAINANFVPAIVAIGTFLAPVIAKVKEFFAGGSQGVSAFAPLVAFIQASVVPAFMNIVTALQGFYAVYMPIVTQVVTAITSQWSTIAPYVQQAFGSIVSIITGVMQIVALVISRVTTAVSAIWQRFGGTILAFVTTSFGNVARFIGGVMKAIAGVVKLVLAVLKGDWSGAWNAIKQIVSGVWQAIRAVVSQGIAVVKAVVSAGWQAAKALTSAAWNNIKNAVKTAVTGLLGIVKGIKSGVTSALSGIGSWLYQAGRDLIQGMVNGVKAMAGSIGDAAKGVVEGAISKAKSALGIASPSKVFDKIGRQTGDGLARGLNKSGRKVQKASEKMTRRALKGTRRARLTRRRNVVNRTLSITNAALKEARTRLADLQKQSADYALNLKNNVLSYGSVTNLNSAFTSDALLSQMKARLSKAKQFASVLASLGASGLNKAIVDDLAQAGVEGGLATALAIQKGGKSAVIEFNALQGQLNSVGTSLGKNVADTMYKAGINAAQGLVNGLASKSAALTRAANNIAKALTKTTKKRLKIKSPSRVFKQIGVDTVRGIEVGLKDVSGVQRASTRIGSAMVNAFDPSLRTTVTAASRAGGDTYNVTVNAPVGSNPVLIGKEIQKYLDANAQSGGRKRAA